MQTGWKIAGGGPRTCATCEWPGRLPRRASGPRPLGTAGRGHLSADGDRAWAAWEQRRLQRGGGAEAHRGQAAGEAPRAGAQRVRVRARGPCGHKKTAHNVRAQGRRAGTQTEPHLHSNEN